jgi:serine/threonine protein kinase
VSKAKGSFGSQWKFMKKDFNKKFVHEGRHEYHIMAILNTLDKAKNGDGGKHIVTVQNVPSRWQGGFAFQMPLALFSLADFQEDRSRVSGLTNGFILKSLVGGVEFLHKNNIAHGDIKPANVLVFSKCAADGLWKFALQSSWKCLWYLRLSVSLAGGTDSHLLWGLVVTWTAIWRTIYSKAPAQ